MVNFKKICKYAGGYYPLHVGLVGCEKLLLCKNIFTRQPQLFILGLPRSGTTLIYQYIVHRLNVAYFTNGVGRYPVAPCTITLFQKTFHGAYRSDFQSRYGKVSGAVAPREAGSFWASSFGFDDYVCFDQISEHDTQLLQRSVYCVQRIFGNVPFVNKNVKHLLRLGALSKIFPHAVFLIAERDLQDVAISVLRARHKNLHDPTQWWSVKPPNFTELKDLPVEEQVAGQIIALKQKMTDDLALLDPERVLYVRYEEFCRNPESLIKTLETVLGIHKFRNPPEKLFPISHHFPQTPEEKRMQELICHKQ